MRHRVVQSKCEYIKLKIALFSETESRDFFVSFKAVNKHHKIENWGKWFYTGILENYWVFSSTESPLKHLKKNEKIGQVKDIFLPMLNLANDRNQPRPGCKDIRMLRQEKTMMT